ncbi:MAG: RNA methyltransferase [Fulvivirga sp.]
MLTKASAKFIKSLQLKKYRNIEQLFVVEGVKSVDEVISSTFKIKTVVAEESFVQDRDLSGIEVIKASRKELAQLGSFKTNDGAVAVVHQKSNKSLTLTEGMFIALDGVNDPGNLGTIIRIADWYGIDNILASKDTVEVYNPKVIAASMGSFCRVNVYYHDLLTTLSESKLTKYGAFMSGENIHSQKLNQHGIIVMGNEANGISPEVEELIDVKITIPKYGSAESLNVAMATAIICDNFKRQLH